MDKDQKDFIEVTNFETDKYLSNCKGFVSNDSSHLITYCGTYKKGGDAPNHKTKTIDGFYTIILNTQNWEVKKQYYNELNDKLQKKIIAQNQKFKGYKDHEFEDLKDIRNLFLKSVVYNPNGSLTIYCEFEKWRFKDNSINLYLHGQIVVFELDMTGKLSNTTVIPKAQAMIPDANLGSYIVINLGEKIQLLYSDSKLNDNSNSSEYIEPYLWPKNTTLRYATIDKKGKVIKEALDKGGKSIPNLRTDGYYIVNRNTIITLGYVGDHKELSLVKIEY